MYKNLFNAIQRQRNPNFIERNPSATLLHNLMKIPQPEKRDNMPSYQNFKPNFTHQIDTLYVPTAMGGFKFLIVVVDVFNRVLDAEPIRVLDSTTAKTALIKIYNRGILSQPKIIQSDSGSEFKGAFNDYLQDKNIMHITAPANRHRMVAIVENKNKLLGRLIFHLLNYKDLDDERNRRPEREAGGRRRPKRKDKGATDWYVNNASFRQLIDTVNDMNNFEPITEAKSDDLKITRGNKNILPVGTRVYVALDQPEEITNGKRLHGNFRAGDIRFNRSVKTIDKNVLMPDQPPMYRVQGENFSRTRQQLQVV